jgi:hypothetical protein
MRGSTAFLTYLAATILILGALLGHALFRRHADLQFLEAKTRLVRTLQITDLCLFTEASYLRHLSQTDVHTPFQDTPMSLDHFPGGAVVQPPEVLRRTREKVD